VAVREFQASEVVCDYGGELLSYSAGKGRYDGLPDGAMGFMFVFVHRGKKYWRDATAEGPGFGRLINHSKCHANVSTLHFLTTNQLGQRMSKAVRDSREGKLHIQQLFMCMQRFNAVYFIRTSDIEEL